MGAKRQLCVSCCFNAAPGRFLIQERCRFPRCQNASAETQGSNYLSGQHCSENVAPRCGCTAVSKRKNRERLLESVFAVRFQIGLVAAAM